VPDKTRLHAKHDLNISEIRELLLSLFSDEAIMPKYFSVRNKGYVRNVIVLHISDASDPIALLTGLNLKRPVSVRISRQDYDLSYFPEKLFSISIDDAEYMQELIDKKQNKQKTSSVTPVIQASPISYSLDYYVLSPGLMR
jgi:hypothetical protein